MKVYQTNEIKNIALLGNDGSGKTTLTEALLYESGIIKRRGRITAKNTVSDYFPVEQEYGYSVFSTVFHVEWNGKKLNIIDLHSMGQWIQEGERTIYETVISIEKPNRKQEVPFDEENLDGLNFLAGKRVDEVNKMAELGTQLAHVDGGVPNIRLIVPELNEYYLGQLIYFFEKGCGISGYILGVNPFNQPGVEAYKKNMFALLNKPGYEAESKAIQARL